MQSTTPSDREVLTTAETADYLAVSEIQLRDWRFRRQGPPFLKLGHRTVRYSKSDLDAWLKRQRVTAEAGG